MSIPKDLSEWKEEDMVKYAEELGKRLAIGVHKSCNTVVEKTNNKKRCPKCNRPVKDKDILTVTTSQLRNVFSDINRIRMEWKFGELKEDRLPKELVLLKPKLAYAAGRHRNVEELKKELEEAIDKVATSSNVKVAGDNFFRFVESIVAYHKYYGGS